MGGPKISEKYPPLDAEESRSLSCWHRRSGMHGPVTGGWKLLASVAQLTVVIVVLWCGLRTFPAMTVPVGAMLVGAILAACWLTSVLVFAVGRARFRYHERRYVAWLDALSAEQRSAHRLLAQRRLLEHQSAPRHWVVPADW